MYGTISGLAVADKKEDEARMIYRLLRTLLWKREAWTLGPQWWRVTRFRRNVLKAISRDAFLKQTSFSALVVREISRKTEREREPEKARDPPRNRFRI